jgi:hypothetical protein
MKDKKKKITMVTAYTYPSAVHGKNKLYISI